MHIVVISHSFPTSKTIDFIFVDQLCRQFANKGEKITIIAPQSLTKCLFRGIPISKKKSIIKTDLGKIITLHRPYWFSMGNKYTKYVGNSFNKAVLRTLKRIKEPIDVIYGHFWAQAIAAMPYAVEKKIPLFAVAGEGELDTHKKMTQEAIAEVRNCVRGCICVASKSKNESIRAGFATEDMCTVIPNAINPDLFYCRDKNEMRKKHGFNEDDFIVAFVGQWNSRKGVRRLSDALSKLNNPKIKAIFMGRGAEVPTYKNVLFQGTVNHDILPEYLCCADVFALPTNNEGCSNAVIEAMACGLPILSSDMEFNWDVLNESNSIMWDPYDIDAIAESINKMYSDKQLRESLRLGALKTAAGLTLSARADKILSFIKSRL